MAEPTTNTNLEKAHQVAQLTVSLMNTPISDRAIGEGATIAGLLDEFVEEVDALVPGGYERIGATLLLAAVPRAGQSMASCFAAVTEAVLADLSG